MTTTQYTPPSLCIGDWHIQDECTENADSQTIQNYVAESIEISGAQINVFKLLGVHEQGLLTDLTGEGVPYHSGAAAGSDANNAFDITSSYWESVQQGSSIVTTPAWFGYNFGQQKTSFGSIKYGTKPVYNQKHITTIKIQQGLNAINRVLQARIERSTGEMLVSDPVFTGTGNGSLVGIQPGFNAQETTIELIAISPTIFSVLSHRYGPMPNLTVGQPYADQDIRFTIQAGSVPFAIGDNFTISTTLKWYRVDVVNLPDSSSVETISIKQSAPAAFWRIVPILFAGGPTDRWQIVKLELMDYQATSLDNIQDTLFLENRDRDYATSSIQLKCSYQPFDSVGDLGKFGFSILDQYVFTCSFARMVEKLGRPVVTGDILEVVPELSYDRNMKPVKKFVEITDCGWSAEGYTPQWQPLLYRFQGVQLIPSAETRDILKTPEQQLYNTPDPDFFDNLSQIPTAQVLATEANKVEAQTSVNETGSDVREIAEIIPQSPKVAEQYSEGVYVEDGLPPNGLPYGEGYQLPDVTHASDGEYYRLNYPDSSKIAPRLYKFSLVKGKWVFVESDRRQQYSGLKPSLRNALQSMNRTSLKTDL